MSYKTILAVLQGKADAERVLDCALPLATRFSGHLIGVHSEAIPMPYVTPMGFPDTDFIATSTQINEQRSAEIQQLFESRARREGISFEWQALQSVSGDSAVGALVAARTCDLIIAQQSDPEGDSGALANVETLLFESGRPVLFVPYAVPVKDAFRKVLIAWNGTQQAARAAFDALPFIVKAEQTTLLIIDPPETFDESSDQAGADIAASLARHGANVSVSVQKSNGDSVEDIIHSRMDASGADLIVLGAYSQSWLRRLFFGGVTNSVLRSGKAAAFLSR